MTEYDRRTETPYLSEAAATPLLSADEERALARRISLGDAGARDLMVRANLRLVVRIARDFTGRGMALDDLIAEGNLGLIRATESFDPDAGTRFSSYASHWIKQSIRAATLKQGPFVRLPMHMVTLLTKWRRTSGELAGRLGREPESGEVATALGLSGKRAKMVAAALRARAASPRQEADEGVGPSLDERPARAESADVAAADGEGYAAVLGRLDGLSPELAAVVRLRYGLDGGEARSLREVGIRLGVPRTRVHRLERAALRALAGGAVR